MEAAPRTSPVTSVDVPSGFLHSRDPPLPCCLCPPLSVLSKTKGVPGLIPERDQVGPTHL